MKKNIKQRIEKLQSQRDYYIAQDWIESARMIQLTINSLETYL